MVSSSNNKSNHEVIRFADQQGVMNMDDSVKSSISHFSSIPWCAKLISQPDWIPIPTSSRKQKASTEDSFFAETLQTKETLSEHLSLIQAPSIPLPTNYSSNSTLLIPRIRTFWTLGSGLNGFPAIAHGGLLSALLDEEMGMLLTANSLYASSRASVDITEMTVYMNVRYKAPVETPGTIVVEAWVESKEGRKTKLVAEVRNSQGKVCVGGEAMFVDVPSSRM